MTKMASAQEGEKAKLEEERQKIIDRTKAIIDQAEKTRNSAVTGYLHRSKERPKF